MRTYEELTINEKIHIKHYAMSVWGKRWHTPKPNFLIKLNTLQVWSILSDCIINKKRYYGKS